VIGAPTALFNPLTSSVPLSPRELIAGPLGLIAFLPLVPLVLLLGRRYRRSALAIGGLVWLVPTLGLSTAIVLLAGVAAGTGWIILLVVLRRRERLGRRGMIALVWVGLHALVLPLWWYAQPAWYPSRMAIMHNVGFAYFLLRLIAWGTEAAAVPQMPLRLADTVCWLLYPPCMRLGPVLVRADFLRRLDAWAPRESPRGWAGARRLGLMLLGAIGLAIIGGQIPVVMSGRVDYFAAPEAYSTGLLLRVFYLVPIQVYLLLWTYNQLALALSLWVGLPVDDNFHWLPLATSVRDFWRRWHITVGSWLRDSVYIPLGGSRRHVVRNTFAVFGYCGLWHGPSWSFLAWGMSQAVALTVQRGWDRLRARQPHPVPGREVGRGGFVAKPQNPHPTLPLRGGGRDVLWTAVCWLLTMHYQMASIVIFTDFEHVGWRLLRELLWRRGLASVLGG
jgi:D-alanyl-lipoteichoic acid acyltransferase DltB (MBOAT superfamily)